MAVLRSSVMSRKSTTFLLAPIVICKLFCLNILHISFLIASTCLGDFVQVANPSSLYNSTLATKWLSRDNKNSPTASQVSASWHVVFIERGLFCVLNNPPVISRDLYVMRGEF